MTLNLKKKPHRACDEASCVWVGYLGFIQTNKGKNLKFCFRS